MKDYIEFDLENSSILMKAAIMNTLNKIENKELTKVYLGFYISGNMLEECIEERGWKDKNVLYEDSTYPFTFEYVYKTPNNLEVTVIGSLFGKDTSWIIKVL